MLFCYETDKDTNHDCSVCQRQLTHQPHGGRVTVVAEAKQEALLQPSAFEQA